MPKVAIIVLIYNGLKYLPACFGSLKKIDYPKEDLEIIAVDNNSQERTVDYLKKNFPEITLIESKRNLGYTGGNNLGLRYALKKNFDYFFILNHDTEVKANFLKELVSLAEKDKKIGILQPKVLLWPETDKIQTSGNKIHYLGFCYSGDCYQKDYLFGEPKEIAYASGSAMLVRREVLEKIGLFDEDYFMYHEDVDLGWLTHLAGYKIMVVPRAVVYHKYSFSRNKKKFFWMERNRFWVILKNYKIGTLILIFPAFIFMEIGLIFYSLVSGWFIWKIKSYFSALSGLNKVLKKRKKVQRERVVGDREFSRYLTGVVKFEDINNPVLSLANIFFNLYWKIIKQLIFW